MQHSFSGLTGPTPFQNGSIYIIFLQVIGIDIMFLILIPTCSFLICRNAIDFYAGYLFLFSCFLLDRSSFLVLV